MDFEKIKKQVGNLKKIDLKDIDKITDAMETLKIAVEENPKIKEVLNHISEMKNATYQVWTDGACSHNPGAGGWAALIRVKNQRQKKEFQISGGAAQTTNNAMELTAAIEALKKIPQGAEVEIITDSQYLKRGMLEWLDNWEKRGWKKADGKPVLNKELWKELKKQKEQKQIRMLWVKAHSKIAENELCDKLAKAEIQNQQSK
jgi:ribonuclease HI